MISQSSVHVSVKLTPLFHPIRVDIKTNCDLLSLVFPCFASTTCAYFEF